MLAAAGVQAPKALDELRIEGLDLQAIRTAIGTAPVAVAPADLTRTIRIAHEGGERRLLPRVVPVPALTSQQAGAVLLLYDVTDLVRFDEMRSELVAVASHELQTPLTTLRMTLLMLQESANVLPERQRELVATSLIGVEQLSEIVHEFLDLTRIEAGELRLNLEPVQISMLIADALRRADPQAKARGIALDARVASSPASRVSGCTAIAIGLRQHSFERLEVHARRWARDRRESGTAHERRKSGDGRYQRR